MSRKPMNIRQFFKRFPDDDACLDHLMRIRYGSEFACPKCGKTSKFHRVKSRKAFEGSCGHQVYPMAGTPFAKSRTPLQFWFFTMFLFTTTRNGISAKEIQRQLGVTYKTAWRMGHEIRKYMGQVDGDDPIGGRRIVEVDKAYIGGKDKQGHDDKAIVLGMVERGGNVLTRVVKSKSQNHVMPHIFKHVKWGTRIATDESYSFSSLSEDGYPHGRVNHRKGEYVRGEVHTNNIEGFWACLKRGINGTHVWVSKKHLQTYLGEFEFWYNCRQIQEVMFDFLLMGFSSPLPSPQPVDQKWIGRPQEARAQK